MARNEDDADATPARPPTLKKQGSSVASNKNQPSILGFFSKTPTNGTPGSSNGILKSNGTAKGVNAMAKSSFPVKKPAFKKVAAKNITPVPSSDTMGPSSSQENENGGIPAEVDDNDLPLPSTPAKMITKQVVNSKAMAVFSSPSRKVCLREIFDVAQANKWFHQAKKVVSYAESADEGDEDAFDPAGISTQRRTKGRRRQVIEDEDDEDDEFDAFVGGLDGAAEDDGGSCSWAVEDLADDTQTRWMIS
jgi:DNA mismatch repair protein MSH6